VIRIMSKKVIIVGSGAGGCAVARELALKGFNITVLEAGSKFSSLNRAFSYAYPFSRLGLLGGEKTISKVFPHMKTTRASDKLVVVTGQTMGGCTTISCGNIVRADRGLKEIGLDLKSEFDELEKIIGIAPIPFDKWRSLTLKMFKTATRLGLDPTPTQKAVNVHKCTGCGLCELGCAVNAKWDARKFLDKQIRKRVSVICKTAVKKLIIEGGVVKGVEARKERESLRLYSDIVVLAAGGLGTAQILKASGVDASDTLWVDIVSTLGGICKGAKQLDEPPMVWYTKHEDYILSPYIDILSVWFYKPWRKVSVNDRVGIMLKLADSASGMVTKEGDIIKQVTNYELERIDEGLELARQVMENSGVNGPFVRGLLNGGHLGGTVPLRKKDIDSMKPSYLPDNLWVADLSLAPRSQGMPTMLLASALALRVARKIIEAKNN